MQYIALAAFVLHEGKRQMIGQMAPIGGRVGEWCAKKKPMAL